MFETLFAYAYVSTSRRHDHKEISGTCAKKGGYVPRMVHATKRIQQTSLQQGAKAFTREGKRIHRWRQMRSSPKTNTCRMCLCYTLSLISTVLISSVPLYTVWVSKTFPFRVCAMVVQRCLRFRLHTISVFIAFRVLLGTCTV